MDVVIFCGGQGTRLIEKTEIMPKPLVPVGKFPILWHIMKIYHHYGYSDFILPLGYKGTEIKRWFIHYAWHGSKTFEMNLRDPKRSSSIEDWNIAFQDTGVNTGTAMRLLKVKSLIKSNQFHITYGDGVADIDIKKVVEFHNKMKKEHGVVGTISAIRPYSKYGIIEFDESNLIKEFREKPQMEEFVNVGFMVFEKKVFDYFDNVQDEDMLVNTMLPLLAKKGKLAIYCHDGFFHAMDSYKDFTDLNKTWKEEEKWKVWDE